MSEVRTRAFELNNKNDTTVEYILVTINNGLFGIPVSYVRDVHCTQNLTRIPLAPKEIEGAINLRGRIATVISLHKVLGFEINLHEKVTMSIVIELNNDLYSLIVDTVGDVVPLNLGKFSHNSQHLSPEWQEVASSIYPLDDNNLLVILDIKKLIKEQKIEENQQ